jgi:bacterioferritin
MDTSELFNLLNEDLGSEYQSTVHYTRHIATIKGAQYQALIGELRRHIAQELDHAMSLADQIDFPGGTPTLDVPAIAFGSDEEAALRLDLDLEEGQLRRYRERIEQAKQMNLPDVAEALLPTTACCSGATARPNSSGPHPGSLRAVWPACWWRSAAPCSS